MRSTTSATPTRPQAIPSLCDGILEAVGNTPLIRLRRLFPGRDLRVWGKLEATNPGGSLKDRPAVEILSRALESGRVRRDSVIVESTSGNMGVGLAQACRYHGLRFICVVDPKATPENIRVLRAYGAEVDEVEEPDPETGEYLQARLRRVRELVSSVEGCVWLDQYSNLDNPGAHYRTTMSEIVGALEGRVDYVFVATSTCGTIRGCSELIRDRGLSTRIVAVDAEGSLIFGSQKKERSIPGLGASIVPPHSRHATIRDVVLVNDVDCVRGCRLLARREAILAGGSSGGVVMGIHRYLDHMPPGSTCVGILPDRGERYLRTVYDDAWVDENVGREARIF